MSEVDNVNKQDEDKMLFPPTSGRDLREDYPELKKIKEFANLDGQDLKFVWFYANPTSPIARKHKKNKLLRVKLAMANAYGNDFEDKDPKKFREFRDHNFPNTILVAIDKMRTFSLSYRSHARVAMEKAYGNILSIAETPLDKIEDISDKKNYTNTVKEISNVIPKILSQLESGFGIRDVENGDDEEEDDTLMNQVLENE